MGGRSSEVATAYRAAAITPSATAFPTCRALYIGVTGNITVNMAQDDASVQFLNVPVGIFPIQVSKLTAATATGIVALY